MIVVDGDSQVGTNKIIDLYGIRIAIHISESNNGIYDAWNKGVNATSGKWVMFVNADDILLPNAINKYIDMFVVYPQTSIHLLCGKFIYQSVRQVPCEVL